MTPAPTHSAAGTPLSAYLNTQYNEPSGNSPPALWVQHATKRDSSYMHQIAHAGKLVVGAEPYCQISETRLLPVRQKNSRVDEGVNVPERCRELLDRLVLGAVSQKLFG